MPAQKRGCHRFCRLLDWTSMLTQIILVSTLSFSLFAQKADDTKELEVFLDEVVADIESRDGKSFQAKWHKQATLYSRKFFFPFDRAEVGSNDWSEMWVDFFSRINKIDLKETDFSFRRIGDVGMVWGSARMEVDRKGSTVSKERLRVTLSLIRESGFWKLLSWHDSPASE